MIRGLLLVGLVAALCPSAEAGVKIEAIEGGARYKVLFRFQPVIAARQVAVAGSFNGWSKTSNLLRDSDGDGTFELSLVLPRGTHHYKFVLNDSVWQQDMDNPKSESDGHSGFNSVLALGANTATVPGALGDGRIAAEQVIHDPDDLSYACAVDGKTRLVLRVHVLKSDVEFVRVHASPRPIVAEGHAKDGVVARRIASWEGRDVFEARLAWTRAPSKVRYSFELGDGDATAKFPQGRKRFSVSMKKAARFLTPEWVRDAVFYQIFPDRFADGDPETRASLPDRPEGKPWHVDDRYVDAWGSRPSHFNFMGGDLAGITEKADYIQSLGVNVVYLNPIFKAASNHRYDASDYETIDPALGTIGDFHALRDALEERGIRLILDCVFNHTGDTHYAFQDAMKKGPKSKYWSWYFFDGGFPVVQSPKPNYRAWWGFGSLPQLDTNSPDVIRHLMGVGKQWLAEGASGWRLDVPNEVDAINPEFWRQFRTELRAQDPEAYLVGEIWTDARDWLRGDKFDAVMNYPVRSAALEFLVKGGIDAKRFAETLGQQLATYPEPALRVQFNLLGSHDTARLLTLAGGDARRVRLALTFLFAYKGAPVVYYGDEVGLDGGKDPACRKTFPWEEARQDRATLDHVKTLGRLRAAEAPLRRGDLRFLHTTGQVCAFAREAEVGETGRTIVCVLNASPSRADVSIPTKLSGTPVELLSGAPVELKDGLLTLSLPALGSALVALD